MSLGRLAQKHLALQQVTEPYFFPTDTPTGWLASDPCHHHATHEIALAQEEEGDNGDCHHN